MVPSRITEYPVERDLRGRPFLRGCLDVDVVTAGSGTNFYFSNLWVYATVWEGGPDRTVTQNSDTIQVWLSDRTVL